MHIVITAVPAREPFVTYLRQHLPEAVVVWDRGQGAMETFRRAWETYPTEPQIKLQDDILLCKDFLKEALEVIITRRNFPIQFFSRRKDDEALGSRWLPGYKWMMNQAHYLPSGMAGDIAMYAKRWDGYKDNPTADDILMADFFREKDMMYWNHCPSLVQHATVTSAINPRRSRFRDSKTFVNPELSGFPEILA